MIYQPSQRGWDLVDGDRLVPAQAYVVGSVIGNDAHTDAFAFIVPNNGGEIGVEIGAHCVVKNRHTLLCAKDNMDEEVRERSCHGEDYRSGLRPSVSIGHRTWGCAPRWYIAAPPALLHCALAAGAMLSLFGAMGCNARQSTVTETKTIMPVPAQTYPARPTAPPPPFKLFHQTADSLTLVTADDASDEQIEAILWQLRDAAQAHGFDKLHLAQAFIDKRDPIVFFHIYRGSKCASEKYADKLPCGGSYHAAGDFTLGSFANRDRTDGALLIDENHQTELWNPDARN